MSEFDMNLLKTLRASTGAGLMECKKALIASDMDINKSVLYLKENGIIKAASKSSRDTGEGIIVINCDNNFNYIILEINCETDFVAKNKTFIESANTLATKILNSNANIISELPESIINEVKEMIVRLGENIKIKRFRKLKFSEGHFISPYLHQGASIGVLLEVSFNKSETKDKTEFINLTKDISMHIAAMSPKALTSDEISKELIDEQKLVFLKQLEGSGKPENIVENIVKGKIKQFLKENVLLDQPYVKNDKVSIKNWIFEVSKNINDSIVIKSFIRFRVGQND